MQLQCTSWESIDDLISKIKLTASLMIDQNNVEIERKWLVDYTLIEFFKSMSGVRLVRHLNNLQGYLSVNPEVRYRSALNVDTRETYYYASYKTDGELSREEYEVPISITSALKFAKVIREDNSIKEYRKSKFITKDYYVFTHNGVEFEISLVDNDNKFTYMEIEFKDIESAENFEIPEFIKPFIIKEVTNDSSYKMKNYWKKTRLKK